MRSQGDGCPGRTSPSLPLDGFAVLNDTPVACQIREPTDPQGDRWHGEAVADEVSPRSGVSAHYLSPTGLFRAPARALSLSPTAPFLPTAEEMGERTPAETAFLHFLSALCLFAAVRFPSRNRRFPDRCRSPDCASTAFRCRCLLLRQKLFVLPCRRLRNNYILCPTGTPTFAALRRQRRDLIIANASSAPDPTLAPRQRQRRKRYKRSLNRQCYPLHFMRECIPPNLHDPQRAKGPLDRRSKRLSFPHFFLRRKKCGRRRPPPRQGKANSPPGQRNPPRAKGSLNRRFEWFSLVTFF